MTMSQLGLLVLLTSCTLAGVPAVDERLTPSPPEVCQLPELEYLEDEFTCDERDCQAIMRAQVTCRSEYRGCLSILTKWRAGTYSAICNTQGERASELPYYSSCECRTDGSIHLTLTDGPS